MLSLLVLQSVQEIVSTILLSTNVASGSLSCLSCRPQVIGLVGWLKLVLWFRSDDSTGPVVPAGATTGEGAIYTPGQDGVTHFGRTLEFTAELP